MPSQSHSCESVTNRPTGTYNSSRPDLDARTCREFSRAELATGGCRGQPSESKQSSHHSESSIMESTFPFLRLRLATSPLPVPAGWYAVPLRLIVGLGFVEHGYAKLSRGADAFIAILHAIGVPFPDLLGWATIVVEIIGGLLILFGAFVPVAAAPMIIVLLVAILTVHLPNGFSSIKLMSYDATGAHFGQPGYETDLLYVAGLLALCLGGAGPLSLDTYLARSRTKTSTRPGLDAMMDDA
jgi:putative oxidoreductase